VQHLVYVNSHCKPRAVRTVYASPFTFGNHACSINDRWFLFNHDESLLINRYWIHWIIKSEALLNPRVLRATPCEKRLPCTTPDLCIALNRYTLWWLTISWHATWSLCLFTKKITLYRCEDGSLPLRENIYEV